MRLYSPETVLNNEANAAQARGLSLWQLMQRAGEQLYFECSKRYRSRKTWLILAGAGNNGGDAYLVGKHALDNNYTVILCALSNPKTELGQKAKNEFVASGGKILQALPALQADMLIIDGLFGAGFHGELASDARLWIQQVNAVDAARVSIDVPSGVCAATGWVGDAAFCAALTLQLVGRKQGLYTARAEDFCGERHFNSLSVELTCPSDATLLGESQLQLPIRPHYFNKGSAGHVKVVGGGIGMAGAAYLSGLAALRSGAGKVSIYCHPQNIATIAALLPEAMVRSVEQIVTVESDVLVIGPGMGRDDWAYQALEVVLQLPGRKLLDADGLYCLPLIMETFAVGDIDVITPHPGEAARLLGVSVLDVERDRFDALQKLGGFAEQVVLKGNGSLVWDGRVSIIGAGSAAMAAPGMGDVLCGVIAALMAQGVESHSTQGVLWHALAGELPVGSLASEVANRLPSFRAIDC